MPANPVTGLSALPLDDQMVPGATYVFQFKCSDFFCVSDKSQAIQTAILAYGPGYISSLQVVSPTSAGGVVFGATTNLYNVQFTYTADGSDVVSDVANELVVAVENGSGNSITFIGAVAATIPEVTVGVAQAASTGAGAIGTGIGNVVGNVLGGAAKGATSNLGFDAVLGIALLALLAYFLLVSGAGAALAHRNA